MKKIVKCSTCGNECIPSRIYYSAGLKIISAECPVCGDFDVHRSCRAILDAIEAAAKPLRDWYINDNKSPLSEKEELALEQMMLIILGS